MLPKTILQLKPKPQARKSTYRNSRTEELVPTASQCCPSRDVSRAIDDAFGTSMSEQYVRSQPDRSRELMLDCTSQIRMKSSEGQRIATCVSVAASFLPNPCEYAIQVCKRNLQQETINDSENALTPRRPLKVWGPRGRGRKAVP